MKLFVDNVARAMAAKARKIAENAAAGEGVDLSEYTTNTQLAAAKSELSAGITAAQTSAKAARTAAEAAQSDANSAKASASAANTAATNAQNTANEARAASDENTLDIAEIIRLMTRVAAPTQDGTVEGAWMKFASYTFPHNANHETVNISFSVVNRVASNVSKIGKLHVRARHIQNSASFAYYTIEWSTHSNIDPADFVMCLNPAGGVIELYVNCPAAYSGYVFKNPLEITGTNPKAMGVWELHSPTSGISELPSEADGWEIVESVLLGSETAAVSE